MKLSEIIACICEGSAERAIIELLLENELLIFNRDKLLDCDIITCRNAKKFENRYLRKSFDEKISVIRILDSRREQFNLSPAYQNKIDVINVITAPEIEMLIIISENKIKEFNKTKKKPSEFCKDDLKMKDVKSYNFVKNYFSDIEKLVKAIHQYHHISKKQKNEFTLQDLLNNNLHCYI